MKAKYVLLISLAFALISCGCSKNGNSSENDEMLPGGGSGNTTLLDKEETVLRIVQYNVGAFSKYMENSTQMIADMLKEMEADVCSINETDSMTTRTGNVYQMEKLNQAMGNGWNFQFGRALYPYQNGAYGNGILTKDEMLVKDEDTGKKFVNIALPEAPYDPNSGRAETRAALCIETEDYIFVSTHIDSRAAVEQLAVMVNGIEEHFGDTKKPVFVAGDFNLVPTDSRFEEFRKKFKMISVNMPTAPSDLPSKCIDYVFVMGDGSNIQVKKAAVPDKFSMGDVKKASDHLPIYVDVVIKKQ